MTNDSILENLKILGIYKSDQLKIKGITYWHLKIFRKNIRNEEKLIAINNAKEELDSFKNEDLRKILDNYSFSEKNNNKSPLKKKDDKTYLKYGQLKNDFDNNLKNSDQTNKVKRQRELPKRKVNSKKSAGFNKKSIKKKKSLLRKDFESFLYYAFFMILFSPVIVLFAIPGFNIIFSIFAIPVLIVIGLIWFFWDRYSND